jgi:hypothetical protein
MLVKPKLIDPALDQPERMLAQLRSGGPYPLWAAINNRHEQGKDLPWFQTFWARYEKALDPRFEAFFHNERFVEASRETFGAQVIVPSSLLVNMNAPMAGGHPHLDKPLFRGARDFHFDLLLAMGHSGLFHAWAVPIASIICWYYRGLGGDFDYWPDGPEGSRETISAPVWNLGVVSDNEYMFHRVGGVGADSEHMAAGELGRAACLRPNERDDGWTIVDGRRTLSIPAEKLRVSLLWKALVFRDEAERAEYENGSGDLTMERTLKILSEDLDKRGVGRLDLEAGYASEENRRLIQAAYKPPRLRDVSRRRIE